MFNYYFILPFELCVLEILAAELGRPVEYIISQHEAVLSAYLYYQFLKIIVVRLLIKSEMKNIVHIS
jgi:hypothetical protein